MAEIIVLVQPNGMSQEEIEPCLGSFVSYICRACVTGENKPGTAPLAPCEMVAIPSSDILSGNISPDMNVVVHAIVLKKGGEFDEG